MKNKPYLGELEQMLLLAILQLGDDAYGLNICKEVDRRGGRKVTPGALYATLDRLEGKRVVTSRFADPQPGRGGKPKRYVSVTMEGKAALREARAVWTRMAEGLEDTLKG